MSKLARHSFFVILSRLFEGVAAMANSIIVARLLGPDGRGKYALILSIIMLLSAMGTLGISEGNVYLINRGKYSIHNFIANSICFAFCSSILWFGLFFLFYILIGYRLLPTLAMNEILLPLTFLPFYLLFIYCQNILVGIGAIHKFIWTNIFLSISPLLFLAVFLFDFKLSLREAIYAYMLSYGSTCFYLLRCCIREAGTFRFYPNAALARDCLTYGFMTNCGTIFQIARDRLETVIIGYFMTNSAVGYYNIAIGLSDRLRMLPKTISYLLFSEVSKSEKITGDLVVAKTTRNILWIMFPIILTMVLFSKYIILILYGLEFLSARVPLLLLLGSVLVSGFMFPLASLFLGQGRPKVYLLANAVGLVTTIFLDMWFIPRFGLLGAATANILGLVVITYIYFYLYKKNSANALSSFLLLDKDDWQKYINLWNKIKK